MKPRGSRALLLTALAAVAALFTFPILWMLLTALRPDREIFARTFHLLPSTPIVSNFSRAFTAFPLAGWLLNSTLVAVVGGALSVILDLMAGYAFAKFEFRGRDLLFKIFLATMMMPTQVYLVPQFMTVAALGGVNTLWAAIVPKAAETYGVFLARQFLAHIPDALLDAARLDGASEWRIFWRIVLPLSKPAIAILSLLLVLGYWNDFGWPLVVLKDPSRMTLPVGLSFLIGERTTDWSGLMVVALVSLTPIMCLFIFLQRYFIQGISRTGIK